MKIAIIGYGHVGKAMHKLFTDAVIYDPNIEEYSNKDNVMNADAAFICVPTPQGPTGKCDTSIVEDAIEWIDSKVIVIRSTVYVGFTDMIAERTGKAVVFQPEYYGETPGHPFADLRNIKWQTFGGKEESVVLAEKAYSGIIDNVKIIKGDAKSIEMAKYMENAFLAMKVTFVNEMYDIANGLGADFQKAREAWLEDPRIGKSHSIVFVNNRGYSGKCFPKDISNIITQASEAKVNTSFIEGMVIKNEIFRKNK